MKTRGVFAVCAALALLFLAEVPASANHHFGSITNNTSKPITGLTFVFNTPKNGPVSLHPKLRAIPLRGVVKYTLPDSMKDKYGATVDLTNVCLIDLNVVQKDAAPYWLRGRDLCVSPYIDARDSSAYAYSSYTYATPMPDVSPPPATPAPTPTASLSPSDEEVDRGAQLFIQGRFPEAIKFFDLAIKLDPANTLAFAYRGRSYFLTDRFDRALADLDQGLRLQPNNSLLHAIRGLTLWSMGVNGSAADDFKVTFQGSGGQLIPYWGALSALAYRDDGNKEAARAVLLQCKKSCSEKKSYDYVCVRYLLGEATAQALLAAAKTTQDRSDAHAFIGLTYLQRGDSRSARPYLVWIMRNTVPINNWRPNIRQRLKRMH